MNPLVLLLTVAVVQDNDRVVARDSSARMERLADGVYAIIHDEATRNWPSGAVNWPHSNVGVIVGDAGVLVIDSDYFPSRARADIALIRQVTSRPVRWLVNTHWHGDHTHGNGVYREIFPDVAILGTRANRDFISINLARLPAVAAQPNSGHRASLRQLDSVLAAGRDSAGPLTPGSRRLLETAIHQRRAELAELALVRDEPPNVLFEQDTTLMLGRRRIVIRNWDRANSMSDVTVYLPAEQILFTGDIVVHPVPYAWASMPGPWRGVLRGIAQLPVRHLVPGHGPVMQDHRYTQLLIALFDSTAARIESHMRAGRTLAEIERLVTMDDFRPRFVLDEDPTARAVWASSIPALVERMHQCVQGYRC